MQNRMLILFLALQKYDPSTKSSVNMTILAEHVSPCPHPKQAGLHRKGTQQTSVEILKLHRRRVIFINLHKIGRLLRTPSIQQIKRSKVNVLDIKTYPILHDL